MASSKKPDRKRSEKVTVNSEAQPWNDLAIGEKLGPVEYRIKPSTHQKHCDLLNIHLPWFEVDWNLFPWELAGWARAASRHYGQLKKSVQTGFRYEFFQQAKVGQPLFNTWTLLDKYVKKGHSYFISCTETKDKEGNLLIRVTTEAINLADNKGKLKPGGSSLRKGWSELGEYVKASPDLPEGLVLLTRTKGPLPMRVSGFTRSGWSQTRWQDSIHEETYAHQMGFRSAIVEG
ncbi:hypothetical protein ACFLTS_06755, partial [Chloroflexota bacterium]